MCLSKKDIPLGSSCLNFPNCLGVTLRNSHNLASSWPTPDSTKGF